MGKYREDSTDLGDAGIEDADGTVGTAKVTRGDPVLSATRALPCPNVGVAGEFSTWEGMVRWYCAFAVVGELRPNKDMFLQTRSIHDDVRLLEDECGRSSAGVMGELVPVDADKGDEIVVSPSGAIGTTA